MKNPLENKDYVKGLGRAEQFANRGLPDGKKEFHDGFLNPSKPEKRVCEYCEAGDKPIQLKRQRVHRIGWRIEECLHHD